MSLVPPPLPAAEFNALPLPPLPGPRVVPPSLSGFGAQYGAGQTYAGAAAPAASNVTNGPVPIPGTNILSGGHGLCAKSLSWTSPVSGTWAFLVCEMPNIAAIGIGLACLVLGSGLIALSSVVGKTKAAVAAGMPAKTPAAKPTSGFSPGVRKN